MLKIVFIIQMTSENNNLKFDRFKAALDRSSHQRRSVRKGVLRNLGKFTGKQLCQSLFLNKVAGLATLSKLRLWHWRFPVNFVEFLRTPFFIEHLWWLLLSWWCYSKTCSHKKGVCSSKQKPFMNKKINKEIMKTLRPRNKFLNTKSDTDRKAYNKQRNLCVSLIRSEKESFFSNINTSDITDSKIYWKTVKPFFTDKIKTNSKITLIEKKGCLPGRSRRNSFRKNNYRRSHYGASF